VMTGVGAVVNTAKVAPGRSSAVVGLGGVGLNSLLALVTSGAYPIIAADVIPSKLDLAMQLGATHAVLASDRRAIEQVRDLTRGGVDFAFEMAGSMPAMDFAYAITARGGTTVSAGLPRPDAAIAYPHAAMVSDERTIKGSYMGSCIARRDIPRFLDLYLAGKLPVDRLHAGDLKFEGLNEGFDKLADGSVVRQTLRPNCRASVIASGAKQSSARSAKNRNQRLRQTQTGLLRRFAPRNDAVPALTTSFAALIPLSSAPWQVEKKCACVASPAKKIRPSNGVASFARSPAWPGSACE
jgi:hypothetical protein